MIRTRSKKDSNNKSSSPYLKIFETESMQKKRRKTESYEPTGISETFENPQKSEFLNKKRSHIDYNIERSKRTAQAERKIYEKKESISSKEKLYENNKRESMEIINLDEDEEYSEQTNLNIKSKNIIKNNNIIYIKSNFGKLGIKDVFQLFSKYGNIKNIRLKNELYGFVQFYDISSVSNIIRDKNKIFFNKKKLIIDYAKKNEEDIFFEASEKKKEIAKKVVNSKDIDKKEKIIEIEDEKGKGQNIDKFTELQKQINQLKKQVKELEESMTKLNVSIRIMEEINNQTEIYSKEKLNNMNKKLELILNAYRILYMRKLANLLLEQLYKKYSNYLEKIKIQIVKKNKYTFIAVKDGVLSLNKIDRMQVNLIIDFLKFIWDKGSSIIHINYKRIKIQKEILFEYIKTSKNNNQKQNPENLMEINELIGIIFESKKKSKNITNKVIEKDNDFVKKIKRMIKASSNNEIVANLNITDNDSIISLSDSEELNISTEGIDEKELKNIIGEEVIKIDISSQFRKLIKKIKINQNLEEINQDIFEQINGEFLYNLWKDSFNIEKYKLKKVYINYNKKEYITTLEKMGSDLCILLKGIKIDLFIEDPKGIDKIIQRNKGQ
mgnify:CR=1 FL=1